MFTWKNTILQGIVNTEVNGVHMNVYRDRISNLIEMLRNSSERFGQKHLLIDEERKITFKDFDGQTTFLAKWLIHRCKIKKGDRISLLMKNTVGFCIASFAILKAGGIVVPLNTKLKPAELDVSLEKANPALLIIDNGLFSEIGDLIKKVPMIRESEFLTISDQEVDKQVLSFPAIYEHDPAFILFTSGTTGHPKGAVLSHFNIIHACINYERCYKLSDSDSTIIAVPIFHGTGLFAQFMPFVYLGGTIVLLKTFDAEKMLYLCEKYGITHTIVVPTIYTMLLNVPMHREFDLQLKVLGSGGAPLPCNLFNRMMEWLPGVKLINTYGLTEATSPAIITPYEMAEEKIGSIGIPSPITECKIINPDTGNLVPPNQPGELLLRGPIIINGYWNNENATKKSIVDGWLKTGDIAMIDEDGFIFIKDRVKDMINRGGEKVYSIEVEDVLYNHQKVLEASVVGINDPVYGEVVKAVVVPKKGENLTENEIKEWVSLYLAKYKVPHYVQITEFLPRNAAGKVVKAQLV